MRNLRLSRNRRGLFVVAHPDEIAVPEMAGLRPLDECHLADELRFYPAALFHLLRRERFAPAGRSFLRQIGEGTLFGGEPLQGGEDLVAIPRHESIFHLGREKKLLAFINSDEK